MSNFLFAFGPEGTDSYYVSNRVFHCWKNLSPKLEDRLKQPSFAADKVESLSIFPNGGFFIVGDNDAYAYYRVPFALQTIINSLSGGVSSVAGIEFDAANAESYVICVRPTRRLHHNALPQQLLNDVLALAFVGLQEICIGYGGTYNLITNHSVSVGRLAGRHSLQVVTLSPYNPRHYFAVFKDGSLEYDLPILWRPVIEKLSSMTNDPSTPKTPRSHNAPLSPPIFSNPAYEPMATQNPTPPYTPEAPSSYAQQQTMYEINQSAPYLSKSHTALKEGILLPTDANELSSLPCAAWIHLQNDAGEPNHLYQQCALSSSNNIYVTDAHHRSSWTPECQHMDYPRSNEAEGNCNPATVWETLLEGPVVGEGGLGATSCAEYGGVRGGQEPPRVDGRASEAGYGVQGGYDQSSARAGTWYDFTMPASMAGSRSGDHDSGWLPESRESSYVNLSANYEAGSFILMDGVRLFLPVDSGGQIDMWHPEIGCSQSGLR